MVASSRKKREILSGLTCGYAIAFIATERAAGRLITDLIIRRRAREDDPICVAHGVSGFSEQARVSGNNDENAGVIRITTADSGHSGAAEHSEPKSG